MKIRLNIKLHEFARGLAMVLALLVTAFALGCGGKKSNNGIVAGRTQLGSTPHSYWAQCSNCGGYTSRITSGYVRYQSQLGDFDMGITLYAPTNYANNIGSYQGPVVIGGKMRIRSLSGCYVPPGVYEIVGSQVSGQFGWNNTFHLTAGQAIIQNPANGQAYALPIRFDYIDFYTQQSFRWDVDGLYYDNGFWGQLQLCNSLPVFITSK